MIWKYQGYLKLTIMIYCGGKREKEKRNKNYLNHALIFGRAAKINVAAKNHPQ